MSVKVGDKIRVTNAYPDFPYKVGDIFEVSETYANSHAVGVKEGYYVGGGMFEIITNEEDGNMTQEKAQVGDLIRITNERRYGVEDTEDLLLGAIYEVTKVARYDGETYYHFYDKRSDERAVPGHFFEIHRKAGEEDSAEWVDEGINQKQEYPPGTTLTPNRLFTVETVQDAVNPQHYKQGRVEVIDIIEDAVAGAGPFEAVCQANVLKYALRYRHKNGVEDLRKAVWYAERLINYIDAKSTQ